MTVNASPRRDGPYVGTGIIVAFPYSFKIFEDTDLLVVRADLATGITTDLVLDSDYSVFMNPDQEDNPGGTVSYLVGGVPTALPVTQSLTIVGNLPFTQPTDITNQGGFYPQVIEDALDRATMLIQQNDDAVSRSLQLNVATDQDFDVQMPAPVAGNYLGWSLDGLSLANYDGADTAPVVAAALAQYISDIAGSAGTSYIGFLQSGIGAIARALQGKLREFKSITDFLPVGYVTDGSVNYATQIQAAIDAVSLAGGGVLRFPPGIWNHGTTQLVFKNNITYVGDGYQCTKLLYTGTSDQVVIQNPINSSTVANIHVEGIYFQALSIATRRGNIFDTGSSLITFERCFFYSGAVGLILDQTELCEVHECYMAGAEAGAWLVNGTDRNPGASTDFTNRIKFESCQFNGSGAYIGIVDDGGVAHAYRDNNFNAGTNYLRIAALQGLVISGGEYELATGSGIHFRSTKWNGAAAFASTNCIVSGGYFYNAGSVAQVDVGVAGFGGLTVENCTFNTAGNPFAGFNNAAGVRAENNRQQGAGTGYTGINNYFTGQTFTCTWTGATTNPVLGNGTLVANVSRHGQRVTMTILLTAGTTTTFGTGNWMFSLPFAESNIGDSFPVQMACAGGLYIGVGAVGAPAGRAGSIFTSTSSSLAVQNTVPAAWAANSSNTLRFTANYLAANTIG